MKKENKEEMILAQWQTCVEMANSVSQRRDSMNNIFITLNLGLITAVSITFTIKSILILFVGILLCILWRMFIRNYKLLNSAKFEVINRLELQLPTRPFNDEWELLQKSKKCKDTTLLENAIPIIFIVLYICIIISLLIINNKGGN